MPAKTETPATVEHSSLAEALAAFQGEAPTFKKGKTAKVETRGGGSYTYSYADLGDILPVVNPLLAKHGLSWAAKLGVDGEGDYVLSYCLRHVSGEDDGGTVPLAVGQGARPQELGAAITYMRRYALTAHLGLATEEDTDARETQEAPARQPRQRRAPATSAQAPKEPRVGAQRWEQIKAKLSEANMPNAGEWLRTWLVGQGVADVPAELKGAHLMALTPEQGDQLIVDLQAEIDTDLTASRGVYAPPEDHGGALDVAPDDEPPAEPEGPLTDAERADIEAARRIMAGEE